jgi:hypothetical protein
MSCQLSLVSRSTAAMAASRIPDGMMACGALILLALAGAAAESAAGAAAAISPAPHQEVSLRRFLQAAGLLPTHARGSRGPTGPLGHPVEDPLDPLQIGQGIRCRK